MFEDLILDSKKLKKATTDHGQCPACGGTDIDSIEGKFVPNGYAETLSCKACGSKWIITYDVDLNIVDNVVNTQYGS
jgi:formate dehydrogenase maturation protein FdhE